MTMAARLLRIRIVLVLILTLQPDCVVSFQRQHATQWGLLRNRRLETNLPAVTLPTDSATTTTKVLDELGLVQKLSQEALLHRGQSTSLQALEILGDMCTTRLPFPFSAPRVHAKGSVLQKLPGLVPPSAANKIFAKVMEMQQRGWLSTNPDSVDDLPGFHLNLVSGGEPIVDMSPDADLDDFQRGIRHLTELVTPHVYQDLLPKTQRLLNSTQVMVSDIFLRRYGQDMIDGKSRNGISAHYDVFSQVTCVIALDDVARQGTNGLFTTHVSPCSSSDSPVGQTSNHASLRRFFPLATGDGVVHTWDILHGVDVEPGLDRTSLVVWFTTDEQGQSATPLGEASVSPWLSSRKDLDGNHVAQFVLASALESSIPSDERDCQSEEFFSLYLESAKRGNAFALTRMGGMIDDTEFDDKFISKARDVIEALRPNEQVPEAILDSDSETSYLTKRFWWEGATRGNPIAQVALGDEIMVEAMDCLSTEQTTVDISDRLLLAGVLFALAAQQGNEHAEESLQRVIQVDVSRRRVQDENDFLSTPVVRVANAAYPAYYHL